MRLLGALNPDIELKPEVNALLRVRQHHRATAIRMLQL